MRRIAELTWAELAALDRARTVVFVPISPIEAHGPHLPAGTDYYVAQAFAEHLAAEIERRRPEVECLLAPVVPIGCGVLPMVGSLGVRWLTVRNVAVAMGRSLARDGFRTIVAVSGHLGPTHLIALERAAASVSRRFGVKMLAPAIPVGREVLRGATLAEVFAALEPPLTQGELRAVARADHGGMLETSVMLHVRPDLVRPLYQTLPPLTRMSYLMWRGRRSTRGFQGYVGEPARARAEIGAAVMATLTKVAATLVEEALRASAEHGAKAPPGEERGALPGRARRWTLGSLGVVGLAGVAAAFGQRSLRWVVASCLPAAAAVGRGGRRGPGERKTEES